VFLKEEPEQVDLLATCFTLVSWFAYSLALKMEVTWSSETSADYQQTTRHYIPEDRILYKENVS
jgi:hypothetical protein